MNFHIAHQYWWHDEIISLTSGKRPREEDDEDDLVPPGKNDKFDTETPYSRRE